ncbi:hypothetical protein BOTBODRAFT_327486 [Botryobasidium botryosum FD-172 SS1]|uniref:Uncharacterized protein n=1 Tax=Botryobasidium botryosum (strain FD-172 SS1) TaxID=930990 RepID=A0A067NA97_BOTB1|nr:hypothetical protein BOTBODRAFT_327486 [Botryobasidium botryosum FD-172 SS1]
MFANPSACALGHTRTAQPTQDHSPHRTIRSSLVLELVKDALLVALSQRVCERTGVAPRRPEVRAVSKKYVFSAARVNTGGVVSRPGRLNNGSEAPIDGGPCGQSHRLLAPGGGECDESDTLVFHRITLPKAALQSSTTVDGVFDVLQERLSQRRTACIALLSRLG